MCVPDTDCMNVVSAVARLGVDSLEQGSHNAPGPRTDETTGSVHEDRGEVEFTGLCGAKRRRYQSCCGLCAPVWMSSLERALCVGLSVFGLLTIVCVVFLYAIVPYLAQTAVNDSSIILEHASVQRPSMEKKLPGNDESVGVSNTLVEASDGVLVKVQGGLVMPSFGSYISIL